MENIPFRPSGSNSQSAQHAETTHKSAESSHRGRSDRSKKSKFTFAAIIVVVVVILAGVCWFVRSRSDTSTAINTGENQALFLTNGQVYFGKLQSFNSGYFKLTNIYYLQADPSSTNKQNPQQTNSNQDANVQLVKLGSEIHAPEDSMVVSRDQVLFFENLKSTGKVSQSIKSYQDAHKQ